MQDKKLRQDTTLLTAEDWINALKLEAHPEGGFYRQVFRSEGAFAGERADAFPAGRAFMTGIYYLLKAGQVSRWHKIRSDELWHFYAGSPLLIHQLTPEGDYVQSQLGRDVLCGEALQVAVLAGRWFGASLKETAPDDAFALVGCTVAPGFDFNDFELADISKLRVAYPDKTAVIEVLT